MNCELESRSFVDLPTTLIQALGVVSVRYGQAEYLLTLTIKRTSDDLSYDEAFAKVEEIKYGDEVRREVKRRFKDWVQEKFDETEGSRRFKEFDQLINEWARLAERRHDVIHCCWTVGEKDGQLTGTRKGKLLTTDSRPLSIKDVEDLGSDLTQVVFRLNTATKLDWLSKAEKKAITILPPKFKPGWELPSNLETTATAVSFMLGSIVKPSDD
jgi:hypothetical protein